MEIYLKKCAEQRIRRDEINILERPFFVIKSTVDKSPVYFYTPRLPLCFHNHQFQMNGSRFFSVMGKLQSNGWILTLVLWLCNLNLPFSFQQNHEWLNQFSKLRCLFLHWWMIVYNRWTRQNWRLAISQFGSSCTTPLYFIWWEYLSGYPSLVSVWSLWLPWSLRFV